MDAAKYKAQTIEQLLLELRGRTVPLDPLTDIPPTTANLNIADVKTIVYGNQNVANQAYAVDQQPDPAKVNQNGVQVWPSSPQVADSMSGMFNASDDTNLSLTSMNTALACKKAADQQNSETKSETKTSFGQSEGFESAETAAGLLSQRLDYAENEKDCTGTYTNTNTGAGVPGSTTVTGETTTHEQGGAATGAHIGGSAGGGKNAPINQQIGATIGSALGGKAGKQLYNTKDQKITADNAAAKDRREVEYSQGVPPNQLNYQAEANCNSRWDNAFSQYLAEKEGAFHQKLRVILNALKAMLIKVQDYIDTIMIKIQLWLDAVISKLKRWMTIDIALGGKMGFDTGLIKCAWSIDFRLKIDLLGFLLGLLAPFLKKLFSGIFELQQILRDFLQKVICTPIRLIEALLGAANSLLNLIGCSLKDIALPAEFLDILALLNASLNLRQLVLRGATDELGDLSLNLKKGGERFKGLQQFAAFCQGFTLADALDTVDTVMTKLMTDVPLRQSGTDLSGQVASGLL